MKEEHEKAQLLRFLQKDFPIQMSEKKNKYKLSYLNQLFDIFYLFTPYQMITLDTFQF
jgi:hypothetical protein